MTRTAVSVQGCGESMPQERRSAWWAVRVQETEPHKQAEDDSDHSGPRCPLWEVWSLLLSGMGICSRILSRAVAWLGFLCSNESRLSQDTDGIWETCAFSDGGLMRAGLWQVTPWKMVGLGMYFADRGNRFLGGFYMVIKEENSRIITRFWLNIRRIVINMIVFIFKMLASWFTHLRNNTKHIHTSLFLHRNYWKCLIQKLALW